MQKQQSHLRWTERQWKHCLLFCFVIFPLLFLKVILGGDLISVGSWLHARFEPGKPSKTSRGLVRFN